MGFNLAFEGLKVWSYYWNLLVMCVLFCFHKLKVHKMNNNNNKKS
jgi:hypothetical protein